MNVRSRIAAWVVDQIVDRGLLGDVALRRVMRRMLRRRHRSITGGGAEQRMARKRALIARLRESDVAIDTDAANEQHYEVPTELFERMLGPRLKYSCALWDEGTDDLAAAEDAMLELTCQRAELADGLDVLELGCGWGSLTLWMAERFPRSRITAVSNSSTQRAFIVERARELGLDNVTVVTCDVNDLGRDDDRLASLGGVPVVGPERFDRVVSVEMFEHVRNHTELTSRIATWLRPGGKLFVHVFAHRSDPYPFEAGGSGDWMARHFFAGGLMPSDDLLLHTVTDLSVEDHWVVSGRHYARTLRAWLDRLDAQRGPVTEVLAGTYGSAEARAWFNRWRVFDLACEELFAFDRGDTWHVSHYRFVRSDRRNHTT